jgi:hypothetical protein
MFEKFLESTEFADVCLRIHSKDDVLSIFVHRIVLCARSHFFARLFSKQSTRIPYKSNVTPLYVVNVPSIDAFFSVLLWMYSNDLKLSLRNAFAIQTLASQWHLSELLIIINSELELLCLGARLSCIEIKHKVSHELLSNSLLWNPPTSLLLHLLSIILKY